MTVRVDGSKIYLSGTVGDLWFDEGFTNTELIVALAEVGPETDVTIWLNSGGGIATEGTAIHSTLSNHKGRVTIVIVGIAASAASVLAMAADEIVMSLGSVMMVHDPAIFAFGTAEDLAREIRHLEAIATSGSGIYAKKTGKTAAACRVDMKAELWMTPEQAVEAGYADRAGDAANDNSAAAAEVTAFAYDAYQHAPQRLVALAKAKNWTLQNRSPEQGERRPKAQASATPHEETITMPTEKERADAAEAELARVKAEQTANATELTTLRKDREERERVAAIMALPEAEGRKDLAETLADAGVTVEKAKASLAKAPKAEEPSEDQPDPKAYDRARMSGAGLRGQGGGQPPKKGDFSVLRAAVDRTNAAVKRA